MKKDRYQRIMSRLDKRRPMKVKELLKHPLMDPEGLILDIKVLSSNSGTTRISWTEKSADEMAKRDKEK